MNFITVQDKKITGHFSGDPVGIPRDQGEVLEVPEQNEVGVGTYIDEYNPDWILRPLKDRIADGTARWVPEDMKLDEKHPETLRYKTRVELVQEGKEQLLPHEKIVDDQIVEKTLEDRLADGLVSQAEYDQIKQEEKEGQIKGEISSKMPEWLIQGLSWEQMQAEVQKIKDTQPKKVQL